MGSEIAALLPSVIVYSCSLFKIILSSLGPSHEKECFLHFFIQLPAGYQCRKGLIYTALLP